MAWSPTTRALWRPAAAAVVTVGLALAARAVFLVPLGVRAPWITFFPAVILAALAGGFAGGLLATILGTVAVAWVWPALGHPPFLTSITDWLLQGLFVAIGILVSVVGEALRRARERGVVAVKALRERESQLRGFLDAIPSPLYLKDRESRWVLANRAALDLVGKADDQVIGRTDREFLADPAAAEALRRSELRVLESGGNEVVEERVPTSAGVRTYQSTKVPYRDASGRVVGIIGSAVDVTERKRTEEVLAFLAQSIQSGSGERFFQDLAGFLARVLDMHFVCIDRLEGDGLTAQTLAVWCDGAFQDNVAYALKDTPCGDVVGKEVCCFPASVCQYFPRDVVLQDLRAESYVGVTLWSHAGAPIGLIAVIGRSPLADPAVAASVLKMVSSRASNELERLETERALRESEELFRTLFEEHSAVKLIIDPESGRIVDANRAAASFYGWSRERLREMRIQEINTLSAEEVAREMAAARASRRDRFQFRHRRADGSVRDVEVFASRIDVQGRPLLHSIVHDETARRRAEEDLVAADEARRAVERRLALAERLAALGTLVAGVAHEINNPLAAELSGQGVALEVARDARMRLQAGEEMNRTSMLAALDDVVEALGDAQEGGQRIARIVRDMAAFARPELQRTNVRLLDVVDEAVRWLPGPVLQGCDVRIEKEDSPVVLAAAGQLQQVVVNLLTNAAKSIPPGRRGRVVIRVGSGESGDAFLEVADDGVGIDPAIVGRIFDPFFTTRPVGEGRGSGLGLAVSQAIASSHGGTLTVRSVPGQGSTFRLELPAALVEA